VSRSAASPRTQAPACKCTRLYFNNYLSTSHWERGPSPVRPTVLSLATAFPLLPRLAPLSPSRRYFSSARRIRALKRIAIRHVFVLESHRDICDLSVTPRIYSRRLLLIDSESAPIAAERTVPYRNHMCRSQFLLRGSISLSIHTLIHACIYRAAFQSTKPPWRIIRADVARYCFIDFSRRERTPAKSRSSTDSRNDVRRRHAVPGRPSIQSAACVPAAASLRAVRPSEPVAGQPTNIARCP